MAPHAQPRAGSIVTFTGLDPALAALGEAISLLASSGDDSYEIRHDWFTDPITKTRQGFGEGSASVAELLRVVLGQVAGQALGIPVEDPALLGTWYPLKDPTSGKATGLYLVSFEKTEDGRASTAFGLGVRQDWQVPTAKPAAKIGVWGLAPLLLYREGRLFAAFDQPGFPISLGLAATGATTAPLIDTHGCELAGVRVGAGLDLYAASRGRDALDLAIEVLGLKLPGEEKPRDRSLADLAGISGEEILETVASLFLGAVQQASPAAESRLAFLLPMLGFSARVPEHEEKLPLLAWHRLFAIAAAGGDVARPFIDRWNSLAADPDLLRLWLATVAGFLGSAEPVRGSGSRTDPFVARIYGGGGAAALGFSAATEVAADGIRFFYPGLEYVGSSHQAGSYAAVRAESRLELAQFRLAEGAAAFGSPTALSFSSYLTIQGPGGNKLLDQGGYRIGSVRAGGALGLDLRLAPLFEILDVGSPNGDFARVDLLAPDKLAEAAETVLVGAVTDGLKKLLGLSASAAEFVDGVAALLGIQPPRLLAREAWPAALEPPFAPRRLAATLADPVRALGDYWQAIATSAATVATGVSPLAVMVRAAGAVFVPVSDGASGIEVKAEGEPPTRFTAALTLSGAKLPLMLEVTRSAPAPQLTRLTLGFVAASELSLGGILVKPGMTTRICSLDLPAPGSGLAFAAAWAPSLGAELLLPQGLASPPVAGVQVALATTRLRAGWSLDEGWVWSLLAEKPVLKVAGQADVPLGQSLDFSQQSSWTDLIRQGGATFSPLLVSAIGLALARGGTRPGLAVTGLFGLLPDLSSVSGFPAGLAWPKIPQLALADLANPVAGLRQRLALDFASAENAKAMLGLLDWAIHRQLTSARPVSGEGSFEEPWRLPLSAAAAGKSQNQLTVWYDPAGGRQVIGCGLANAIVAPIGPLRITCDTRLGLFEVALADGSRRAGPTPSLELLVRVERPGGQLVPGGELGSLGSLRLGFQLRLAADGGTAFAPRVDLLEVQLPGEPQRAAITLADFLDPGFSSRLQTAFQALLDAAIQAATQVVAGQATFEQAYLLLSQLGITLPRGGAAGRDGGEPYGIRGSGWQGLLADPLGFITGQLLALLADPPRRDELFAFVENLLGISLPTAPQPVLELLAALGFLGPEENGYPLLPPALVALAGNPLGYLHERFAALVGDAAAREALATQLAASVAPATIGEPQRFGIFTLTATSQTRLRLAIAPEAAVKVGDLLEISGAVTLDLSELSLEAALSLAAPRIGLTVAPALSYRLGGPAPKITVDLVFGREGLPAAAPLAIYPFDSDRFVKQLAVVAPAYALSVIATGILESELLARYPLVQNLFAGLGLAEKDEAGRWRMPALVGLLEDPKGWLLSNEILGADGRFELASLGRLLGSLPAAEYAPLKVGLRPVAGGVEVYGLPYGFSAAFTATRELARITVATRDQPVAGRYAVLRELASTVQLDASHQPGIAGSLVLATGAGAAAPFYVTAGFDRVFRLTVGAGAPDAPGALALELLPFRGWGSLATQLVQYAPRVVRRLMQELFARLDPNGNDPFLKALAAAGTGLEAQLLLDALMKPLEAGQPGDIGKVALDWLAARVAPARLPETVKALGGLFQVALPELEISAAGLIAYRPSTGVPMVLLLGVNRIAGKDQLGAWARFSLPANDLLEVATRDLGVGLALPLEAAPKPLFSFGLDLTLPLDGPVGPTLRLGVASAPAGVELVFDPLGDAAGARSALARELLPRFFGGPADLGGELERWILAVLTQVLPRYVSVAVLNQGAVKGWLEAPLITAQPSSPTPAALLEATSLVVKDASGIYRLNSLDELAKLTANGFVANFLRALLKTSIRVLAFKTSSGAATAKGEIWMGPDPQNADAFGFRLVAPDLEIPGTSRIVLQVGADDTDWIAKSGSAVPAAATRGLAAYVPIEGAGPTLRPRFDRLKLTLVNLGFDFQGTHARPLVDKPRFRLGAVRPRTLLVLDLGRAPALELGGALTFHEIGIAVAPNSLVEGDGGNAVASNLLGGGAQDPPVDNPATNPTFSAAVAYSKNLWVNLEGNSGSGHQVVIPVQRTFGPLYVATLGIGWNQERKILSLLFGGGLDLLGLEASVQQLTVGIPVTTLSRLETYTLDLRGLNVAFRGGPLELSGGFLKEDDPLNYVGAVTLSVAGFNIVAAGAYGLVDGAPSMFIFGALTGRPLGGPPPFFVTGFALGFGFNRDLLLPDIGGVYDWPLVKGVREKSFTSSTSPEEGLTALARVVRPSIGEYWVAAGIEFRSFQLLSTFALLNLKVGRSFELSLLGVMSATLPPPPAPAKAALAYLELALALVFKPSDGVVSAQAQLTPNSYVLVEDCKITGGFAAFLWFRRIAHSPGVTIPAGQFVISLGGYHPAFKAPPYFPEVPRLGLTWKVDTGGFGSLSIEGGAYFALVPTAIMAGGQLKAAFVLGPLSAWLQAMANFLIEWKPFFFSVEIGVRVGVQFHTSIGGISITLKAALGAALRLQGPQFRGAAEVDWYVISFTFPFGSGEQVTTDNYLAEWKKFAEDFLPAPEEGRQQVVKPRAAAGLLAAPGDPAAARNGNDTWQLAPVPFEIAFDTAVPISRLTAAGPAGASAPAFTGAAAGVRPMNLPTLDAPATARIVGPDGPVDLAKRGITLEPIQDGAPGALWGQSKLDRQFAPDAEAMLVDGALVGLRLIADQYLMLGQVAPFPILALKYEDGIVRQLPYARTPQVPGAGRYGAAEQRQAFARLMGSIMASAVIARRDAILAALEAADFLAPAGPDLAVMAASANLILVARPTLARLGVFQTTSLAAGRELAEQRQVAAPPPTPPREPQTVAVLRRYRVAGAPVRGVFADRGRGPAAGPLAAFDRALGARGYSPELHAGTHVLWQLDRSARHGLALSGEAPVRLSVYDRYHRLLAYRTLAAGGAASRELALPEGAQWLLAQGCDPAAERGLWGWHDGMILARIDPYHAAADGVLLRTQNHVRKYRRHLEEKRGLVSAEELLDGNRVEAASGLVPGWVQTLFERPLPSFAVWAESAAGAAGAAGAEPRIAVSARRGRQPEAFSAQELSPTQTIVRDGGVIFLFEAPPLDPGDEDLDPDDLFLAVLARPLAAGTRVRGVAGFAALQRSLPDEWSGLEAAQEAFDPTAAAPAASRLQLTIVADPPAEAA